MIINCIRCGTPISSPNAKNADYIIAADTVVTEEREVIVAVHHNATTLEKLVQMEEMEEYANYNLVQITDAGDGKFAVDQVVLKPEFDTWNKVLAASKLTMAVGVSPVTVTKPKYTDLSVADEEYTRTVKASLSDAHAVKDLVRVEPDVREVAVQKTGIICPECYLETDVVIWGVHKNDK